MAHPSIMSDTPHTTIPATAGEDVRRSPQRNPTQPRLAASLPAEEAQSTRDQPRQPDALSRSPAPVSASGFIPLSVSGPSAAIPAAASSPAVAKSRSPKSFEPCFIRALPLVIASLPASPSPAAILAACRRQWDIELKHAARSDHHAPVNAGKLARRVQAALDARPPAVVPVIDLVGDDSVVVAAVSAMSLTSLPPPPPIPAALPAPSLRIAAAVAATPPAPAAVAVSPPSAPAFHLADHQLLAGELCNLDKWEDLKVVVWGISMADFKSACLKHQIDCSGWVKVRHVDYHHRLEILCSSFSARVRAIFNLRQIRIQAQPGRRYATRCSQRAGPPPSLALFVPPSLSVMPSITRPDSRIPSNRFAPLARHFDEVPPAPLAPTCVVNSLERLSVISLNCHGWSALFEVELAEVHLSAPNRQPFDIIALQETHLFGSAVASLPGYFWLGQNCPLPRQRGVGFLCRRYLQDRIERCPAGPLDSIMWIKINLKPKPIFLCSAYGPQERSDSEATRLDFHTELMSSASLYTSKGHVCILLDANARIGKVHPRVGKYGETERSPNGDLLLDTLEAAGLRAINNSQPRAEPMFTRSSPDGSSKSVLDYVLVSDSLFRPDLDAIVLPTRLASDHFAVFSALDIPRPARKRRSSATRKKWRVERFRVAGTTTLNGNGGDGAAAISGKNNNGDPAAVCEAYQRAFCKQWMTPIVALGEQPQEEGQHIPLADNVNTAYAQVTTRIANAADEVLGSKRVNHRSRAWWDNELKDAIARRRAALLGGDQNEYRRLSKEAHRLAKKKKEESMEKFIQDLEGTRTRDNARFWTTIKRLGGLSTSSATTEIIASDGTRSSDPKIIRETFKEHFDRLGNQGHATSLFDEANFVKISAWAAADKAVSEDPAVGNEFTSPPTIAEIRFAIKAQAVGAPGTDGLPVELLKYGGDDLSAKLSRLFALWFIQGKTPDKVKESTIVPLHKKEDAADPNNYRGITLLNVIGKIYARVLNARLVKIVEPQIGKEQAGFINGRNTIDQALVLSDLIERAKSDPAAHPLYIAFLDIVKAYDTVWRDALWYKVEQLGVPRKLRKVIEELVTESCNTVQFDGERSGTFAILIGLRQGCVLSPLLFDIFINDFISTVPLRSCLNLHFNDTSKTTRNYPLHSLLFADDVAFVANSEEKLQSLLDLFNDWCNKWRVVVSVPKSKVLAINHKSTYAAPLLRVGMRGELEVVSEFKYLGIWFSDKGTWDVDSEKKLTRYHASVRAADKLLHCPFLSPWVRVHVWAALCRPHLEYGAEIIRHAHGSNLWKKLCSAQMKTLKSILSCPISASNALVLAECALPSLESRYEQAHLRLLHRLTHPSYASSAVLPREVYTRPGFASKRKSGFRVFLKEEATVAMYNVCKSRTDAVIEEHTAKQGIAERMDTPPPPPLNVKELWRSTMHNVVAEAEVQRLITQIKECKAPGANFFTTPKDFEGRSSGYLKTLRSRPASLLLRARTGTLPVGAHTRHFANNSNQTGNCASCLQEKREVQETQQHFLLECPCLQPIRNKYAALAHIVGASASIVPSAEREKALLNPKRNLVSETGSLLTELWQVRCAQHYSNVNQAAGGASGLPTPSSSVVSSVLVTSGDQLGSGVSAEALFEESDPITIITNTNTDYSRDADEFLATLTPPPSRPPRANGQLPQAEL